MGPQRRSAYPGFCNSTWLADDNSCGADLAQPWTCKFEVIKTCATALIALSFLACTSGRSETADVSTKAPVETYTVQGLLELKEIRYSVQNRSFFYSESKSGFEITVSGCKWLMKLGTHDPKVYDYRIVSSDGVDTYLLLNYETRHRLAAAASKPISNLGDGMVIKGNVPYFEFAQEAGTIWIAYASGCHFGQHSHDKRFVVPHSLYVKYDPIFIGENPVFEDASFSLSGSFPNLPEAIVYYFHPVQVKGEPMWEISSDLTSGDLFINLNYQTLTFTNLNGLHLPKEAISLRYRPNSNYLPAFVPQLCEEVHLTTTNVIINTSVASFIPELPGYTSINEARLSNGNRLVFELYATNEWPSEAVAKASQAYARVRGMASVAIPAPRLQVRLIVIGAMAVLPLALWGFSRYRRHSLSIHDSHS